MMAHLRQQLRHLYLADAGPSNNPEIKGLNKPIIMLLLKVA